MTTLRSKIQASLTPLSMLLVVGCAPLISLPDGRSSGMSADNTAARVALGGSTRPGSASFSYRPVRTCSFTETKSSSLTPERTAQISWTERPVADRLQVVLVRDSDPPATYLLSRTGHIYGFNGPSALDPTRRINNDNETSNSQETIQKTTREAGVFHGAIHTINDFTLYMPEFRPGQIGVGQTAAIITTEDDGKLWASYVFMGVLDYNGTPAALLDLTRKMPGLESRGGILVGYSVVELRTGLPLLTAFDAGSHNKLQRHYCS